MSDGQYNPGPHFDQHGQHVYGPQYNADGIHFNHTDPQSISLGIAWQQQRYRAEQEELRWRHYAAKREEDRRILKAAVVIVAASLLLYFSVTLVLAMLGEPLFDK